MNHDDLHQLANEWITQDKNPSTRAEIEKLLADGQNEELDRRLRNRIEFGTAGLRGKMQAGWSSMNDLTIIQASQGLCAYVLKHVEDAKERGIVIGHDHRHNSHKWARLTAAAFIDQGMRVYLHRGLVHTPLVPFSVKKLNAACGVMITASHNPKQDNGFKVYWENAVQIIEPHDKGIAESITQNLVPKVWETEHVETSPLCKDCTADMTETYLASLRFLVPQPIPAGEPVKFVNTSMHGVGHRFLVDAFKTLSLPAVLPVREQQDPDPEFPTVSFPNPEEHGALDLAIAFANKEEAAYVLAQDPDADRFAAAEKQPDGSWVQFTGDQLGTLFGEAVLQSYKLGGKPVDKVAMVASTVSSKMLESIAKAEGFRFKDCLTGFKYIGNTALDLVEEGYEVPFGYEEAIGFMFGSQIRDKDGIAASVIFVQLVLALHSKGRTVYQHLQELYERFGYFKTSNSYFICTEPKTIDTIFHRLRTFDGQPKTYPPQIAQCQVTSVIDLTTGYDSTNPPCYAPSLPLSSGHMIQFRASGEKTNVVLTIRTSGTEPKIKYYLEGSGSDRKAVEADLRAVVSELGTEWMEAEKHGLRHAGQ